MLRIILPILFLALTMLTNIVNAQVSSIEMYQKGIELFDRNQFQEAISCFTISLNNNGSNSKAIFNRGLAFYEVEKYNKSLDDFNAYITLHPDDVDAYQYRANLKYLLGDFEGSIIDYNRTLSRFPSNINYVNRANSKLQLQKYEDALEDVDEALAIDANDAEAINNKGDIYFALNKFEAALDMYNKAVLINPEDARTLNNRANALVKLNRYNDALMDYNKAISLTDHNSQLFTNRGMMHIELKMQEDAIFDCTEASIVDPSNANAYHCIGLAKWNKKDYDSAIQNFDKAIELSADPDFFFNRAKLYFDLKYFEDALSDFEMVQREQADYPEINGFIQASKVELQRSNSATKDIAEEGDDFLDEVATPVDENSIPEQFNHKGRTPLIDLFSKGEDYNLNKAFELSEQGNYEEAINFFNKVIRNNETIATAFHGRGIAYSRLQQFSAAIEDFTQAIRLNEDQLASIYNRGVLNYDLGKYRLAQRDFQRIIEQNADFGNVSTLWQKCDLARFN